MPACLMPWLPSVAINLVVFRSAQWVAVLGGVQVSPVLGGVQVSPMGHLLDGSCPACFERWLPSVAINPGGVQASRGSTPSRWQSRQSRNGAAMLRL